MCYYVGVIEQEAPSVNSKRQTIIKITSYEGSVHYEHAKLERANDIHRA